MKMQEMQCMLNVILWRVHVTIFAGEKQQCMLCVFELNVTANYIIKILRVAQYCLCGKFMSPATIKRT
jgi:hypothetical protein